MAHRSPKYPGITLSEAVQRAQLVYQNEHQNPINPEVVAQHMGYMGLSGASLRSLSALRQYGLLEGRGDESRISDEAVIIFADAETGSKERDESLRQCLYKPQLFQDIRDAFATLPSQGNLRAFLEKRKFTRKAADKAAVIYRESVEFVENQISDYNGILGSGGEASSVGDPKPRPKGGPMELVAPTGQKLIGVWEFPGVTINMTATGRVTKATLERLQKHLELKIEDYDFLPADEDVMEGN